MVRLDPGPWAAPAFRRPSNSLRICAMRALASDGPESRCGTKARRARGPGTHDCFLPSDRRLSSGGPLLESSGASLSLVQLLKGLDVESARG